MITIEKCCALAEMARKDPSLLRNHRGTVDRKLNERLKDVQLLIPEFEYIGDAGAVAELKSERSKIWDALEVYFPDDPEPQEFIEAAL